jgi:hypothetical protein
MFFKTQAMIYYLGIAPKNRALLLVLLDNQAKQKNWTTTVQRWPKLAMPIKNFNYVGPHRIVQYGID